MFPLIRSCDKGKPVTKALKESFSSYVTDACSIERQIHKQSYVKSVFLFFYRYPTRDLTFCWDFRAYNRIWDLIFPFLLMGFLPQRGNHGIPS